MAMERASTEEEIPEPTQQDIENAAMRREIAERQMLEYAECLKWAIGAFGVGWLPSHRHCLVSKEEETRVRYTGQRAVAAATVYTVKNAAGDRRHFTIKDGAVVEHPSMEAGFGEMLLEPDLSRTVEMGGKQVHLHRYSLCWAGYELYEPKSAEQLAALRVSRERGKAEREEQAWRAANPLLVWMAENVSSDQAPKEPE